MKRQLHTRILCALALPAFTATGLADSFPVFFGTYTNTLSRGIYVSRLDAATGKLSAAGQALGIGLPVDVKIVKSNF